MLIRYHFPHVFHPSADRVENALVLRAMIDFLIRVNMIYLINEKKCGREVLPLYQCGVYYARTNWWEPIPALYDRGWGDCKSLTAAYVAEKRLQGMQCDPTFRWAENNDGSTDYHILVALPNGQYEDPSKKLGMGANEVARYYGG